MNDGRLSRAQRQLRGRHGGGGSGQPVHLALQHPGGGSGPGVAQVGPHVQRRQRAVGRRLQQRGLAQLDAQPCACVLQRDLDRRGRSDAEAVGSSGEVDPVASGGDGGRRRQLHPPRPAQRLPSLWPLHTPAQRAAQRAAPGQLDQRRFSPLRRNHRCWGRDSHRLVRHTEHGQGSLDVGAQASIEAVMGDGASLQHALGCRLPREREHGPGCPAQLHDVGYDCVHTQRSAQRTGHLQRAVGHVEGASVDGQHGACVGVDRQAARAPQRQGPPGLPTVEIQLQRPLGDHLPRGVEHVAFGRQRPGVQVHGP